MFHKTLKLNKLKSNYNFNHLFRFKFDQRRCLINIWQYILLDIWPCVRYTVGYEIHLAILPDIRFPPSMKVVYTVARYPTILISGPSLDWPDTGYPAMCWLNSGIGYICTCQRLNLI